MPEHADDRRARRDLMTDALLGVDFAPAPRRAGGPQVEVKPIAISDPAGGASSGKQAALDAIRQRHDAECAHCTSVTTHTQTVFGEGHPDADLMFIGEAPGAEEDRTGRPFVGRAGQKLNEIITAMGLAREDVYIANVLKSRPPNNRTPQADEIAACSPYLREQILSIEPKVIVTLGGPATKLMLDTKTGITRLRGVWQTVNVDGRSFDVMPTFHPAYLLRNYTRETRMQVWSDMQAAQARLGG